MVNRIFIFLLSKLCLLFPKLYLVILKLRNRRIFFGYGTKIDRMTNIYVGRRASLLMGNKIVFSNSSLNATIMRQSKIFVRGEGLLSIGDYCGFSSVSIYCSNRIEIGSYCSFGGNVNIWDSDFHSLYYLDRRQDIGFVKSKPIVIGDDVFVGANTTILKGVHVGDRSIIGACSVITRDIGPDEVWAGNPAVKIR